MYVKIQESAFDVGAEINTFSQRHTKIGAITTLTGIVRDNDDETLKAMEIEHYPRMAEKAISEIVQTAVKRWSLGDALVIHRYGTLAPGEIIMMVATAAIHRTDAFQAAEFLMDYLKSRAPFWKKEITKEAVTWVPSRQNDEDALDRW